MKWEKKGLIYCPKGEFGWNDNSFMTPTPILLDNETIRLFGGMRDLKGVSRLGYVDLDANNPSIVKSVSSSPVLDIGKDGMFDDNGVILGDIVKLNSKQFYMYYIGFQLVQKVKFLAFTGLAISEDGGNTFRRYSQVPVMDRTEKAPYIRAIHSVMFEDGIFKVWYPIDKGWQLIDGVQYPAYNIWYTESKDGIHFSQEDRVLCVDTQGTEYRIGRPRVYKEDGLYKMYYTRDFIERKYIAGYAESNDGISWTRLDNELGIERSEIGWDSKMCCYPVLLDYNSRKYMFYNGNDFGRTGVGYAELVKE